MDIPTRSQCKLLEYLRDTKEGIRREVDKLTNVQTFKNKEDKILAHTTVEILIRNLWIDKKEGDSKTVNIVTRFYTLTKRGRQAIEDYRKLYPEMEDEHNTKG